MKIGIVTDKLYPGKIGGAEQYVRNLINIMSQKKEHNLVVFVNRNAYESFSCNKKIIVLAIDDNLLPIDTIINYYIQKYKLEVIFCPLYYLPYKNCPIPAVVSIHDIQYEFYPHYFTDDILNYRKQETKIAAENSNAVITMSEFSKKTIIAKIGIPADKIFVTYESSDISLDIKVMPDKLSNVKNKIGGEYIFYPANGWPHKNHINLLKALDILKRIYKSELKLVLTGLATENNTEVIDGINELNLNDDIINLGYINQEEMPYIYAGARLLVFPSKFEGFGIPLVEAMKSGIPITCSSYSCIPEIAGNAAIYFNADDPSDIAQKINLVDKDDELRNKLIDLGYERSYRFSWDICAEQTLSVLESVISLNKNIPKVSLPRLPKVIIYVFSSGSKDRLKKTIENLKQQNYPNLKYIITKRIPRNIEKEIMPGDILSFINAGDIYNNNIISRIVNVFLNDKNIDAVCGSIFGSDFTNSLQEIYNGIIDCDVYLKEELSSLRTVFIKSRKDFPVRIYSTVCYFYQYDLIKKLRMNNLNIYRIHEFISIHNHNQPLTVGRFYKELITLKHRDNIIPACLYKEYGSMIPWLKKYPRYFNIIYYLCLFDYNYAKWSNQIFNSKIRYKGRYSDGWISGYYCKKFELSENIFELAITINILFEFDDDAYILVLLDNKIVAKKNIGEQGISEIICRVENNSIRKRHKIELTASDSVSGTVSNNKDIRELSVKLDGIYVNKKNIL